MFPFGNTGKKRVKHIKIRIATLKKWEDLQNYAKSSIWNVVLQLCEVKLLQKQKLDHCHSGRKKDPLLLAGNLALKIERQKAQKNFSPL